jgi:hypothetical protein
MRRVCRSSLEYGRLEEQLEEVRRLGGRVHPRTDAQDVRVVVLAPQGRRVVVPGECCRTPRTLLAAIASPLPEPPITTPRLSRSATTASAARRTYGG